ncbi:hypothetical protein D1872_257110 [compost metagenome]
MPYIQTIAVQIKFKPNALQPFLQHFADLVDGGVQMHNSFIHCIFRPQVIEELLLVDPFSPLLNHVSEQLLGLERPPFERLTVKLLRHRPGE